MSKKIMFWIGSQHQRRIGLGNIAQFVHSIYFRAKTWGYDDVWFEWPWRVTAGPEYDEELYVRCPKESILPITFVERGKWNPEEFDKVVDLTDADSMYDGFIPLYERKTMPVGRVCYAGVMSYPNMYHEETGEYPVFDVPKDKLEKPYILFHFRNSPWSDYRNSNPQVLKHVFDIIKEKYGDKYEMWKCGEQWRPMHKHFDVVTPYYNKNIDEFFKMINNASMFVGAAAGVMTAAERLGVPVIAVDEVKGGKDDTGGDRSTQKWKSEGGYGNSWCDFIDKEKYIIFWKENGIEGIDKNKILEFCEKWI